MTEQEEVVLLRVENAALRAEQQILRETNLVLTKEVGLLSEKLSLLLKLIEKQGVKKDSHNSSLAPSNDIVRKNQKGN